MKDSQYNKAKLAALLPILLMLASFTSIYGSAIVTAQEQGEKVVKMTASNFKFKPSTIQAQKGDVLAIEVENVSSQEHNLTVKDPKGKTIESARLPGKVTTRVRIALSEAGTYKLICNKPLHALLGMKGRIEVQ